MADNRFYGTGRRKNAIARVWILPGTGAVKINNRELDEYFGKKTLEMIVKQPLELTDTLSKFDVMATVKGGGITGQAGAIRHGIARALLKSNEEYKAVLRSEGLLTRDPRVKERKKYGRKRARKRFQFSKR